MKSIPLTIFLLSIIFWFLGTTLWFFSRQTFILTAVVSLYFTITVWLGFSSENFQAKFKNKILSYFPYLFLISLSIIVISNCFTISDSIYTIICSLCIILGLGSLKIFELDLITYPDSKKRFSTILIILLFCLILGLYLYLNIVNTSVDNDEIRLLYDAKLITQGLVPFIDFNARSPALIYLLSGLYHFFGTNLLFYRIFTAIVAWSSTIFLYFIGKRFLSRSQSMLSASLYAFLPVALNFLYIKTETFSIFFALLSILLFILSHENRKPAWARYASHLMMLVALFIRPTALVFYLFHFLISIHNTKKESRLKEVKKLLWEIFIVGTIFLLSTILFFRSHNSLFYTNTFKSIGIDSDSFYRFLLVPYYIPIPIIIVSVIMLLNTFQKNIFKKPKLLTVATVITVLLIGGYIVNAFLLGFWPQYCMDFAVPIAILTTYSVMHISQIAVKKKLFFFATIAILFISFLPSYLPLNSYLLTANSDVSFLRQVTETIDKNTNDKEIIFSGSPEFAFMSDRRQFLNLSHSFYDPQSIAFVIKKLNEQKPKLIVIDKYYIPAFYINDSSFQNLLASCYDKIDTQVYKLKPACLLGLER